MRDEEIQQLQRRIAELKEQHNAVLLVHNYQIPEVQDIADFMGDSLGLSRRAAETDADVIVFCGVHFMAETAKLLSPDRTVLIPDKDAGCPMADMVDAQKLREFRRDYPGVPVVAYVNTSAETKAEADICCTSANAVEIVNSVNSDEVIFVPDCHLGSYAQEHTDKKVILWEGYCPTHVMISPEAIRDAKAEHPDAKVIVHGECPKEVRDLADEVASTGGMVQFAQESDADEIIVGTEYGMVYRLQKENPDKTFYALEMAVCRNMKKITLPKVAASLEKMQYEVEIPQEIADAARRSVERMLEHSS
ncbi:MAG: quinolinate synthase NadA [Armatimonadota bacterium]